MEDAMSSPEATSVQAAKATSIHLTEADSVLEDLEAIERRVMQGAYDCFLRRGGVLDDDLRGWFAAEDEIAWKPAVEVRREGDQVVVDAALADVTAEDLELKVTPDELLITAEALHEHDDAKRQVHGGDLRSARFLRCVSFPARIDPHHVTAEYRDGLLHVQAKVAGEGRARY
jgi:HSP20 family molecular chaperone IbpA